MYCVRLFTTLRGSCCNGVSTSCRFLGLLSPVSVCAVPINIQKLVCVEIMLCVIVQMMDRCCSIAFCIYTIEIACRPSKLGVYLCALMIVHCAINAVISV